MNNPISPLTTYIDDINPELSEKVNNLTLYDAVCEICAFYGVQPPKGTDLISETLDGILDDIKKAQS